MSPRSPEKEMRASCPCRMTGPAPYDRTACFVGVAAELAPVVAAGATVVW